MYDRFFEEDQQYVGFFKFPEDPDVVPGHLVIRKKIIEGQIYRIPKDLLSRPDLPLGFGINTNKILNAVGVFRLKGGKDVEVSIFGIQVVSGSSSQLGLYEVYCQSMILKGKTNSMEEVFPKKMIVKIKGLEEWFEKKAVDYSHDGNKISISSEERIIETLFISDQVTIDLECYANFNFKFRDNIVREIVAIVIGFKGEISFPEAIKREEKLRQVFSLFFRKQLRIEEVSFFIPKVDKEFCYIHSDSRDFYGGEIKHRNEAIIRYSDSNLFEKFIKNFLNAEPRLEKLIETFFLMELNHSLYSENAFLTWVFELDAFIKKGEQGDISKDEAMKGFSNPLIDKIDQNNDPILNELFQKFYSLSNERAKFYGETLQTRLNSFFSNTRFFKDLVSSDPEGFFKKIVKTRNHLVHPKLDPNKDVIPTKDLYLYQSKLRLIVYCLILLNLGMNEDLLIERLKVIPYDIVKPLK